MDILGRSLLFCYLLLFGISVIYSAETGDTNTENATQGEKGKTLPTLLVLVTNPRILASLSLHIVIG